MPLFFICCKDKKQQAQVVAVKKHIQELAKISLDERKEPSETRPSLKTNYVPESPTARVVHIHPRTESESRKSVKFVE
jgi:hypothetical protein